jgi:hypothetical protein
VSEFELTPVRVWTLNSEGEPALYTSDVTVSGSAALLAADVAPKWNALVQLADAAGWNMVLVNSMFRTASYQEMLNRRSPGTAASMDRSYHQAGRAFDLSISGMRARYPDFSLSRFEKMANSVGFYRPIPESEPWHFDTNDAGNRSGSSDTFGSIKEAIAAVGNLSTQAFSALGTVSGPGKVAGVLVLASLAWLALNRKGVLS